MYNKMPPHARYPRGHRVDHSINFGLTQVLITTHEPSSQIVDTVITLKLTNMSQHSKALHTIEMKMEAALSLTHSTHHLSHIHWYE